MPCGSYAQRITPEGTIPEGWPADGMAVGGGGFPMLAPDGLGGAYIVWSRSYEDIYAQHLTASGAVASGWDANGLPVCTHPAGQDEPVVTADGLGGAITAWLDGRNGNPDIYAQRLEIDGPVATLISLSSAYAEPGRVVLRWYAASAGDLSATVYRRTETSDWARLGSAIWVGEHELEYEDRQVSAGRYAYRLGVDGQFTDEVWVEVPATFAFRLDGFRPNPAAKDMRVSFSLASDVPGKIELIDVAGRRVLDQEVGSLGAGNHLLDLGSVATLRAGVYWIRLTQSGRSLIAKGIVAR